MEDEPWWRIIARDLARKQDLGPQAQMMSKNCTNERIAMTLQYVALCSMIIMTGVAASQVIVSEDRCSEDCSSGKIGGKLVMAARRLNASAAIETTSNVASSDRRAGPSVAGNLAIDR